MNVGRKAKVRGSFLVALLVLAATPCTLVAAPRTTLRFVDDDGVPLAGMRVLREWTTSEDHRGEDQLTTDGAGSVTFERVVRSTGLLHRLTKPLLAFVPAMCGPGSEVYGYSEFHVFWPHDYTIKFDPSVWKKDYEVFKNSADVAIRDPIWTLDRNYLEIYFYKYAALFAEPSPVELLVQLSKKPEQTGPVPETAEAPN